MLYTRKGDGGTSGLFGSKERLPKDSPIFEALGTLDELNSLLGVCRSRAVALKQASPHTQYIETIQECVFIAQAELAGADKSITQVHLDDLEGAIERVESTIENPHAFVIPGATELSGLCDYARAVSRRAERTVVGAQDTQRVAETTTAYLNRISSFLYALARAVVKSVGAEESSPTY